MLQGKINLTLSWYLGILMFCYSVKVSDKCLSSEVLESLENVTTDFTLLAIVGGLGTSGSSFKEIKQSILLPTRKSASSHDLA